MSVLTSGLQRVFDVLFSGLALMLLSPLLVMLAILLRCTGEGEVFFRQERIGQGGRPFALLKFATMTRGAERLGTGTITVKDDPRVLPLGRFLRKTKLNELPQLINILRGEMSVIGPRPQTPRCFEAFPEFSRRQIVKVRPGLSGVGSVVFRAEENLMAASADPDAVYDQVIMPYKGALEEWYVAHRSIRHYFVLIFMTLWVLVFPRSSLFWRLFPELPPPPEPLKALV